MAFRFDMNPTVSPAGKRVHWIPGWYIGELTGVDGRESQSGEPMVVWEYKILASATGQAVEQGRIWFNTMCRPDIQWNLRGAWEAIGLPWPKEGEAFTINSREELLSHISPRFGTRLLIKLADEEYQGEMTSRVKVVRSAE